MSATATIANAERPGAESTMGRSMAVAASDGLSGLGQSISGQSHELRLDVGLFSEKLDAIILGVVLNGDEHFFGQDIP